MTTAVILSEAKEPALEERERRRDRFRAKAVELPG